MERAMRDVFAVLHSFPVDFSDGVIRFPDGFLQSFPAGGNPEHTAAGIDQSAVPECGSGMINDGAVRLGLPDPVNFEPLPDRAGITAGSENDADCRFRRPDQLRLAEFAIRGFQNVSARSPSKRVRTACVSDRRTGR